MGEENRGFLELELPTLMPRAQGHILLELSRLHQGDLTDQSLLSSCG